MSAVITTTMTNGHYEMKLENGHSSPINGYRKNGYVKPEPTVVSTYNIYFILLILGFLLSEFIIFDIE